jgi:hypothetical protein
VEITFNLPHLFAPGIPPRENAEALRVLLDSVIALNMWYLRHHAAPPLYRAGVVYARTDDWEPIPALYRKGYHGTNKPGSTHPAKFGIFGDCKSLTAALVAEKRMRGEEAEPQFRWSAMPGGDHMFHILVRTSRGFEDPSAKLGMGQDELRWFR